MRFGEERGSEQDDPYSDGWMLRIEDKLDQTKATLHILREQVEQVLVNVPPALDLGENLNAQSAVFPGSATHPICANV